MDPTTEPPAIAVPPADDAGPSAGLSAATAAIAPSGVPVGPSAGLSAATPAAAAGEAPARPAAPTALASGCLALDELLGGGLERDAVTLVFGEGASGKTNFALQCAREAARAGLRVAFVDTEGVSAVRVRQIWSEGGGDTADVETLIGRLHLFKPLDLHQQERMVERATLLPGLGLVVVDSINMHYRLHMDGEDAEREAGRSLLKQLHHLTAFVRKSDVPVLLTGQVYGEDDTTLPFGRLTMNHLVKAVLRFERRPDGTRRATLLKHRSVPDGIQARFAIGPHGLESLA